MMSSRPLNFFDLVPLQPFFIMAGCIFLAGGFVQAVGEPYYVKSIATFLGALVLFVIAILYAATLKITWRVSYTIPARITIGVNMVLFALMFGTLITFWFDVHQYFVERLSSSFSALFGELSAGL